MGRLRSPDISVTARPRFSDEARLRVSVGAGSGGLPASDSMNGGVRGSRLLCHACVVVVSRLRMEGWSLVWGNPGGEMLCRVELLS